MISLKDANSAAARLAVLKHYPQEAIARAQIAQMLMRMVGTSDQLEWLIQSFVNHVDAWPGAKELRAVFCTRFKPADGIEEWSALPGYSALDSEAAYLEQFSNEKRAELEAPRAGGGLKRLN